MTFAKDFGTVITTAFAAYGVFTDYKEDDPNNPGKKIVTRAGKIAVIGGVCAGLTTIYATTTDGINAKNAALRSESRASDTEKQTEQELRQTQHALDDMDHLLHPFVPQSLSIDLSFNSAEPIFDVWRHRFNNELFLHKRQPKSLNELKRDHSLWVSDLTKLRDDKVLEVVSNRFEKSSPGEHCYIIPDGSPLEPSHRSPAPDEMTVDDSKSAKYPRDKEGLFLFRKPELDIAIYSQRPIPGKYRDPLYREEFGVEWSPNRAHRDSFTYYPQSKIISQSITVSSHGNVDRDPSFVGLSQIPGTWIEVEYLGTYTVPTLTGFEMKFAGNDTRYIEIHGKQFVQIKNDDPRESDYIAQVTAQNISRPDW